MQQYALNCLLSCFNQFVGVHCLFCILPFPPKKKMIIITKSLKKAEKIKQRDTQNRRKQRNKQQESFDS